MISHDFFWIYSIFGLLPAVVALFTCNFSKSYVVVVIIWFILLLIKVSPTGSQIPQYRAFCKYRLHCPNELLPKMKYAQIKRLLSVKELCADFDYVSCDYAADEFVPCDYYDWSCKDMRHSFVICHIASKNNNYVVLNPATYFDYFAMCLAVSKGLKSLCATETVDAQLKNLKDIREVVREVQDREVAKMRDVASENKEIENRILNDRRVKIKQK